MMKKKLISIKRFIIWTRLLTFLFLIQWISNPIFSFTILVNPMDGNFPSENKSMSHIFQQLITSYLHFHGFDVKIASENIKVNNDKKTQYVLNSHLERYPNEVALSIQLVDTSKKEVKMLEKQSIYFSSKSENLKFPFQQFTESKILPKDIKKLTPKVFNLVNSVMSKVVEFTQQQVRLPDLYIRDKKKIIHSVDAIHEFSKSLFSITQKKNTEQIELILLVDSNPSMHDEINELYNQLDGIINKIHLDRPTLKIRIGLVHMNDPTKKESMLSMTSKLSKIKEKLNQWTSISTQHIHFEQIIQSLQNALFSLNLSSDDKIPKIILMLTNKNMNQSKKRGSYKNKTKNNYDYILANQNFNLFSHQASNKTVKIGLLPLQNDKKLSIFNQTHFSSQSMLTKEDWEVIQQNFYRDFLREISHLNLPILIDYSAQQSIEKAYFDKGNKDLFLTASIVNDLNDLFNINYLLHGKVKKTNNRYTVTFKIKQVKPFSQSLITLKENEYQISHPKEVGKLISEMLDEIWAFYQNQLKPKTELLKAIELMTNSGSSLYAIGCSGIDLQTMQILKILCRKTKGKYFHTSYEYSTYIKYFGAQSHFIYDNYQLYFKLDPNFSIQRTTHLDTTKVENISPDKQFNELEEAKKFILPNETQKNSSIIKNDDLQLGSSNFSYLIEQVIENNLPTKKHHQHQLKLQIQQYEFDIHTNLNPLNYQFIQDAIKNKRRFFIATPIVPTSTYLTNQESNGKNLSFKINPKKMILIPYDDKKYLSDLLFPKIKYVNQYTQMYRENGLSDDQYWLFDVRAVQLTG